MVNIFGDSTRKVGPVGTPGPSGIRGGLKEVIRWFPQMILEQTRKKLNVLTLLIETIPPSKNADVELSSKKKITRWNPFNDHKDYFLKPVDHAAGEKYLMASWNKRNQYSSQQRTGDYVLYGKIS